MRVVDLLEIAPLPRPGFLSADALDALRRRALGEVRVRVQVAVEGDVAVGAAVLEPREWDSSFFGKAMGKVTLSLPARSQAEGALIEAILETARAEGYVHLMSRLPVGEPFSETAALERAGFSLLDVGTTLVLGRRGTGPEDDRTPAPGRRIRPMASGDLPSVLSFGASLFRRSYFYRDPFIGPAEADRLHEAWIENLFAGDADVIWVCEMDGRAVGFVTCRVREGAGTIALVGVDPSIQRRGVAAGILRVAVRWFLDNDAETISVKTQSGNTAALNLYLGQGFRFGFVDLTYCRSL